MRTRLAKAIAQEERSAAAEIQRGEWGASEPLESGERRDERIESGGAAPIALGRCAPARSFREYIFKFIEIEELV